MTRISNLGNSNENFIVTGDFNVYTSNETAFQKLINPNDIQYTFYDPINQIGAWGIITLLENITLSQLT